MVHKTQGGHPITLDTLKRYHEQNPTAIRFNPENWHKDPNHPQGVRPEIERKFAELVEALNDSPMTSRAKNIDAGKKDGYWSRIIERAARSFENYVIAKMAEKGYSNDYLANVKSIDDFERNTDRYPYLKDEELAPVVEAFDNLFGEMQTKETDKGTVLYSRTNPEGRATYQNRLDEIARIEKATGEHYDIASNLYDDGFRVGNDGKIHRPNSNFSKSEYYDDNNSLTQTNEANREFTDRLEAAIKRSGTNISITPVNTPREMPVNMAARDSGKKTDTRNVSRSSAKLAERIAGIFKKQIVWIKSAGDFSIDGVVEPVSMPDKIFISADSKVAAHVVMGHELSHHLENDAPLIYRALTKTLEKLIKNRADFRARYNLQDFSEEQLTKEMVGNIMGDSFSHPDFWKDVAKANPVVARSIGDKVMAWLNKLADKISGVKGYSSSELVTDINAARRAVAEAVAQYALNRKGARELDANDLYRDAYKEHVMLSNNLHAFDQSQQTTQDVVNPHSISSLTKALLDAHQGRDKAALQALFDSGKARVITAEQAKGIIGEDALLAKSSQTDTPDTLANKDSDWWEWIGKRKPKNGIVKIYRGVSKNKGNLTGEISDGDWVSFDYSYAKSHAPDGIVLSKEVNLENLFEGSGNHPDSIELIYSESADPYKNHSDIRYSKDGLAQAFFNPKDGITYFIADNLSKDATSEELKGLVRHEISIHALNLGRDTKEFNDILRQVELMRKAGNKAVNAAFNRVPADTRPENVNEETLAYLVQYAKDLPIVKRVIAWLRNSIRAIGKTMPVMQRLKLFDWANKLNENDLLYMAQTALANSVQGQQQTRGDQAYQHQGVMASAPQQRFYSQLRKVVRDAPDRMFNSGKVTAMWLDANAAKFGVKKEELYWSGVTDWMKTQGKVSKDDVLDIP